MDFNEEEKRVFEMDKNESFDPDYWFEKYLVNIYVNEDNEEARHNMNVTLNFIKRMIVELSKKRGYDIDGSECYDVDVLLNEIIDVPTDQEENLLATFNPLLYKTPEELNNYFYLLTKDLSWEDLQDLLQSFEWINDCFRAFFANNFEELLNLAIKLYYELSNGEESIQFADISVSDDEEDDDWVEDVKDSEINMEEVLLKFDEFDEFDDWESNNERLREYINSVQNKPSRTVELNEETLIKYVKFINVINEFIKYRRLGINIINKLYKLVRQKKLDEFYSDEEFSSVFDKIMEHDKTRSSYYFHGTQCLETAQIIIDEGLLMMREELETTAYREFTKDDVILYERGFGGEIGHDAIVIIDVPKKKNGEELDVVKKLSNNANVHFVPSGLQGLNGRPRYIVLPENIVGYVDKKNKQIVFNPKYRNYEQIIANKKTR